MALHDAIELFCKSSLGACQIDSLHLGAKLSFFK